MGCSCGYNVYIKTLSLVTCISWDSTSFHHETCSSKFCNCCTLAFFYLPLSFNLYTSTSQPSSYQNGMSSSSPLKKPILCGTIPWQLHKFFNYCTLCTKTIHPHLFNSYNKNNSLATQTQSHCSVSQQFQQAPDPNIIHLQQYWKNCYVQYYFFCALNQNKQRIMSTKINNALTPSCPTLKYCLWHNELVASSHTVLLRWMKKGEWSTVNIQYWNSNQAVVCKIYQYFN
jgi:hypothetical protein